MKGKGERERYTQLNAEFQRIARRDKKAFLSEQCKKSKWLSEEDLQIAEKRREMKGKGERQRYTQLNAEFQRIARRDKKAFLSEQCKGIPVTPTQINHRLGSEAHRGRECRVFSCVVGRGCLL